MNQPRLLRSFGLAVVVVGLVAGGLGEARAQADFEQGDIAVGVSSGRYQIYDKDGNFKDTITAGSGFTTGCAFDADGNLFGTWFSNNLVRKLDVDPPHAQIFQISPSDHDGTSTPESIAFASDGTFFVGHVGGNDNIHHYRDNGDGTFTFLGSFDGVADRVGTDWIDLAADQRTIFHTSEGRQINRFDVVANTQLATFAVLPGGGAAFALRLLPPGDGTGGLLVADREQIKRLDGAGNVIQTYDATGENTWFALNLDANGTSFWSGNFATANFYRFNIATGAIEVGPINTGTGGNSLFGICVLGEITAGVNNPPAFSNPECGTTLAVEVGEEVVITATATDDPAQELTLDATQSSEIQGHTYDPPVPTSGNPVSTTFTWTPEPANEGDFVVVIFTASDGERETECRVEFEIGEDLLVVLRSFEATPGDGEVVLDWSTELEVDNAGFYLLRRDTASGEIVRVNEYLIPAEGDVFQSADYSYVDATAINGVDYEYVLVDVELGGLETEHPGVRVVPNPSNPPIKLIAPAYGAMVSVDEPPRFEWQPRSLRTVTVAVSLDPTFTDPVETLEFAMRGARGRGSDDGYALAAGHWNQIEALAATRLDQPLYWRVVERTMGSRVNVSDTFRLFLDPVSVDVAPQSSPIADTEDGNVSLRDGNADIDRTRAPRARTRVPRRE